MIEYLFTFRSLTQTQTAQRILRQQGILANLQRSPKKLSKNGCAYALNIAEDQLYDALAYFRARNLPFSGLYRKRGPQNLEEVEP